MKWISCLLLLLVLPLVSAHFVSKNTGEYGSILIMEFDPAYEHYPTHVGFYLNNLSSGLPFTNLDMVHGKRMHVFIVGSDLATFTHTHPDDYDDGLELASVGRYEINHTFEHAGEYLIVADYTVNGTNILQGFREYTVGNDPLPAPVFDYARTKQFGEYTVTLNAPQEIHPNETVQLTYHIERDGKNVTNLQQYLGSEMHLFVIDANLTHPDHVHAYIPGHALHSGTMPQRYIGPNIPVQYTFSAPGTYVLFGQFQHENEVVTTQFMVKVEQKKPFPWKRAGITAGVLALLLCIYSMSRIPKRE